MGRYNDYTPQIEDVTSEVDNSVISLDPHNAAAQKAGKTQRARKPSQRAAKKENSSPSVVQDIQGLSAVFRAETYRKLATNRTLRLTTGVILAIAAVYMFIAFISYLSNCTADQSKVNSLAIGAASRVANQGGEGGARLAQFLINDTFGIGSAVIILWMFAMAVKLFIPDTKFKTVNFTIKCLVALIAISLIVGISTVYTNSAVNWGGLHGRQVTEFIFGFFGEVGVWLLFIMSVAIFVILCLADIIRFFRKMIKAARKRREEYKAQREADEEKMRLIRELELKEDEDAALAGEHEMPQEDAAEEDTHVTFDGENSGITDTDDSGLYGEIDDSDDSDDSDTYVLEDDADNTAVDTDNTDMDNESDPLGTMVVNQNHISEVDADAPEQTEPGHEHFPYNFPPYDLLDDHGQIVEIDHDEQLENKEKIRKTLADFGIPIVSIEATVGPTVTLYEIVPDTGVKIAKIRSLVDDIALSLAAVGVRIIAPIPGKGTVGIEVANKNPQTVSMRTVIKSPAFRNSRYKLPIALGSTIGGEVYIADLAKMPHLLVAGATGQGKSVGLNAIITSLLYCRRPDELKFVMVDPKMVEFSLYAKIEKHYLAKLPDEEDAIITDVSRVAATLSSLCVEMDDRYQLLKQASVRNIEEYNKKFLDHKLNPSNGHKFLPYIVIIVDEFSDLIMQSGKEVEMPIARLAQKARAVGMHVIIATQRPSTNVITGIIKSNFPARIAFKVSSGIDSKTILDTTGAQQLIGRGDMLISNSSEMVRVQCAFVDTPEVERICQYIADQAYAQGAYILPEPRVGGNDEDNGGGHGSLSERDPLFEEVARLVVSSNQASTSSLQRRYGIGYNRAGRIMDQLEKVGVVGPAQGGKPRSVLMDGGSLEELLSTL